MHRSEVTVTTDLDESRGNDEVSLLDGSIWDQSSTVALLHAVGDLLLFGSSNGVLALVRSPKTEVLNRVDEDVLAHGSAAGRAVLGTLVGTDLTIFPSVREVVDLRGAKETRRSERSVNSGRRC